MCDKCEEVRKPVVAEVVRRTGLDAETVERVVKALEDMTIEAEEIREREQEKAKAVIVEALRTGNTDALSALFGGADVSVMEVDADGFPAPAPAHPIDRPTGPEPSEIRTGMYL